MLESSRWGWWNESRDRPMVVRRLGDFWRKKCTLQKVHLILWDYKKKIRVFFSTIFHWICCFLACFFHTDVLLVDDAVCESVWGDPLKAKNAKMHHDCGFHIFPGNSKESVFKRMCVCVFFLWTCPMLEFLGHPTENAAVFKKCWLAFRFQVCISTSLFDHVNMISGTLNNHVLGLFQIRSFQTFTRKMVGNLTISIH